MADTNLTADEALAELRARLSGDLTMYRLIWWSDYTGAMSLDLPFATSRQAWEWLGNMPGLNPLKRMGCFPRGAAEKQWHNGRAL